MRIIISHSRTKRRIEGPFNICGSKQDLLRIADLLIKACHDHPGAHGEGVIRNAAGMSYGWVNITDPPVEQEILVDQGPIGWDKEV
jgi:hypothetical protein